MTIWHHKLIKFGVKVFALGVLIILVSLFFYYNLFFKKDNLLKYVPADALAYATFKADAGFADNKLLQNWLASWQKSPQVMVDWEDLNSLVGYNLAAAVLPGTEVGTLNYLAIFDLKNQVTQDKYVPLLANKDLAYSFLTPNVLEKKILVVSNSSLLIEQVKRISLREESSLADKINVVINLKQITGDYQGKLYLNPSLLKEYLTSNTDSTSQIIVNDLAGLDSKDLFLGIKLNPANMQIESPHKRKALSPASQANLSFNFLEDSILNLSGYETDVILSKLMMNFKNNSQSYKIMENDLFNLEKLLKFDIDQDILPLLHKQVNLGLNAQQDWVLGLDLTGLPDAEAKVAKLAQVLQEYLALNHPVLVNKQLPDKTYIKQKVKDIASLNILTKDTPMGQLSFWSKDQDGLGYLRQPDKIYISNKLANLEAIALNQGANSQLSQSSCNIENYSNFSQVMVVNGQLIYTYLAQILPISRVWLGMGQSLQDEIWLCLE